VQFAASVDSLTRLGYKTFVEIGPNATLLGMARRVVEDDSLAWLPSLRKGKDDWQQVCASLGSLYARGARVDWAGFDKPYSHRRVLLPTYPFNRQRYWAAPAAATTAIAARRDVPTGHPLLGNRLPAPLPIFEAQFEPSAQPVLRDHRVQDQLVVPGPVYLEMALAAATEVLGARAFFVDDLAIREPLVLDEGTPVTVQTVVQNATGDSVEVSVFSGGDAWTQHASATVRDARTPRGVVEAGPTLDAVRERCLDVVEGAAFYAGLHERGIHVGGEAKPIERVWRGQGEAYASLAFAGSVTADARYLLNPTVVDAALLIVGAAARDLEDASPDHLHVLTRIDAIEIRAALPSRLFVHASVTEARGGSLRASVRLLDTAGTPVALFAGIHIVRVEASILGRRPAAAVDPLVYDVAWRQVARVDAEATSAVGATPTEIASTAEPRAAVLAAENGLDLFPKYLRALDAACAAYVANAFRSLGFDFTPGQSAAVSSVAGRLGVLPRHHRLLGILIGMLAEDGYLRIDGDRYQVVAAPPANPDEVCEQLLQASPQFGGQTAITKAAGGQLAGVLRGEVDPLHILFPNGSFELTEALYQHGPFALA